MSSRTKNKSLYWWVAWLLGSVALSAVLARALLGADQSLFLPGPSTHGHYQIELRCEACHGKSFEGGEALQVSCVRCHGAELKRADDSHPRSKFTDPRNAERVSALDARFCVTCHTEHRPQRTRAMGVTLSDDFCILCHGGIAKDRPSHRDLPFAGCAASGCHNYHDNRALYEDYLIKHGRDGKLSDTPRAPLRNAVEVLKAQGKYPVLALRTRDQDAPENAKHDAKILHDWANSTHADAGVNCSDCHSSRKASAKTVWRTSPDPVACKRCHEPEFTGHRQGRHGMRLAQDLLPMTPAQARLPMKAQAADEHLDCNNCHRAHDADTRRAAAESCLRCHDDQHSRAYPQSAHARLWERELVGEAPAGSGVSCATCHMPRAISKEEGFERVRVQHNQNDNLRPNEKMIRTVCQQCHGLAYAIDALADTNLVRGNFSTAPVRHVESIDMAYRYAALKQKKAPPP